MTITYVITGTRPNLTIQATDPHAIVVTVSYNTNTPMKSAYNSIRDAFITAYTTMTYTCVWSGTGNSRICQATDSYANTITQLMDVTYYNELCRCMTIGAFVNLYGMSDDNKLYQQLEMY
ncbi:MAG: hypothetical protein O8C67_05020 [Candidatus Methanoperedens sp.]|nr:hypothetical protein [Candidatus Methanoperedens sp.]